MTASKRNLLEQTHQTILKVGFEDNDYGRIEDIIAPNLVAFGTASDEKVFGINDLKDLLKRQKEQIEEAEVSWTLNQLYTHLSKDENTAVYIDEIVFSIVTDSEPIEMIVRFSLVLEYLEDKWMMVHFHSSKPENVESEKDTWGIETWRQRAEELEQEVAARTTDLVIKNRELEIEGALGRIRAEAVAMKSTTDLLDIVVSMRNEFLDLGHQAHYFWHMMWLPETYEKAMTSGDGSKIGFVMSLPRHIHGDIPLLAKWEKSKKPTVVYAMNVEEAIAYVDKMVNLGDFQNIDPQAPSHDDLKHIEGLTFIMARTSHGEIGYSLPGIVKNPPKEDLSILVKFADAFDLAHRRFLDLQKAEQQARKTLIELSLERIRSQVTAMQKSSDLFDVVVLMRKEFLALGHQADYFWHMSWEKESYNMSMTSQDGSRVGMVITVPRFVHDNIPSLATWEKSKKPTFVLALDADAAWDYIDNMNTHGKYQQVDPHAPTQEDIAHIGGLTFVIARTTHGEIGYSLPGVVNNPPAEDLKILERFASVFDLAHRRFLDLQKTEKQAREVEIELAIERVRSRTMAMQHSDELQETSFLLDQQVRGLGIKTWGCAFNIYGENESTEWFGNEAGVLPTYTVPRTGIFKKYYSKGQKGETLWIEEFSGKACVKHYETMSALPVIGDVLLQLKDTNNGFPTYQLDHVVFFKYGYLLFITKEPVPDAHDIFKRFAKVFEQTYTRFLDLQKAEAQAKEALIEAALERVRAKSMAMQSSTELETIIQVVHDQFVDLGITLDHAGFIMDYKTNEDMVIWLADEHKVTPQIQLPYFDSPHWNSYIQAKEMGHQLFVNHLDFKVKNKFYKEIFKYVPELPEDAKTFYLQIPSLTIATALVDTIGLYIENFSGVHYNEEDQKILLRFAEAFQQTYTRFLDLKKAEAQTREAQIEAALEKVRSRSLAMHHSSELNNVVAVLFERLKALDIPATAVGLGIPIDGSKDLDSFVCGENKDGLVITNYRLPYFNNKISKDICQIKDKQVDLFIGTYSKKVKNNFYQYILENTPEFKHLPKDIKQMIFYSTSYTITMVVAKHAVFNINDFEGKTLSDHDIAIIKRFANVFDQSYTRFLDLQKAEAQTRQAQINLAVERVRAKALAMHKSEEIMEVVAKLKDEVMSLDIPDVVAATIFLNEGDDKVRMWDLSTLDINDTNDYEVPFDITFKLKKKDPHLYVKRVWENTDDYFVEVQKEKDFKRIIEWLRENDQIKIADEVEEYTESAQLKELYHAVKKLNNGKLVIDLMDPPSEEMETILTKMGAAFDLAYKRFEDLQRAEAQTREAQIETALERVRTASLAMHKSEDHHKVVTVVFEQLEQLDIFAHSVELYENVEDREHCHFWVAANGQVYPEQVHIPVIKNPIFTDLFSALDNGVDFYITHLTKRKTNQFFRHYFKNSSHQDVPQERQEFCLDAAGLSSATALYKNTTLQVMRYEITDFSTEDKNIIKRIGAAFDQSYTRFLDLQKAEAQTKEANIQLALERVRAKTMAMKTQEDLLGVIELFGEQLTAVGLNFGLVTFIEGSITKNRDWNLWSYTPEAGTQTQKIFIPYIEHPYFIKTGKNVEKYQKTGDPIQVKTFSKEEKDTFLPHYFKHHPTLPEEVKELLYNKEGETIVDAFLGEITVTYAKWDLAMPSKEELNLFERFAKEFRQTYIRFLDIKKAEAQAKEAQIESALEKVRSRSLAMHKPDELKEVVAVVAEKLKDLGVIYDAGGVILCTYFPDNKDVVHYIAVDDFSSSGRYFVPYFDNPIFNDAWDSKTKGDAYFSQEFTVEAKNSFFKHAFENSDYSQMPNDYKQFVLKADQHHLSAAWSKNSAIIIPSLTGVVPSDSDADILKRFAKVFEQAYIRFMDLQRAEAQAREAQIENALEKVRSRTMAMQKSTELPEAANNLFLQVQELGIPAWSAGYCIWQDDKHNASCNMSSEGEIQKSFILPSIGEGYDFYTPQKNGDTFHIKELGGDALVKHYDYMAQLPNMGEILQELINAGLELPTFQIFHIVYFKYGYVMFITYEAVPDSHEIFKRFGKVFEQTYTRFLDLKQAEAQVRKAQIETSLERVRAKAMSMQNSDELDEVLSVLCEQFDILGILPMSTHMTVFDFENNTFTFRETGKYGNRSFGEQTVALDAMDNWKETVDKWKTDKATAINKLHFPKEQLPKVWEVFHESFASMPQGSRITPDDYPNGIYHTAGKHPFGYIGMNLIRPATHEEEQIVIKFANEFGRAYQRFLDLQKAEAQAREAQIEASLERVRSHSMGMQGTKDFAEVTTEMFNQLRSFGEDLFATGIVFCDKHDGHVEQWHSIPGGSMLSPMIVPIDLDYIHQYRYDQWKAGEDLFSIEIPSDFINQHFEDIFKLPSAQITLNDLESRNAPMPETPDWEIDYGASFKNGYILASSLKPLENMDILPRFAKVFEQAYTRYLDLQKAETRAREAQIEMALEKVRSRTMTMEHSSELADTSVVVFKELLNLGIAPNRLFIGIIRDNGATVEAWATNEDGSKIEKHFKLYPSENKAIKKMVDAWQQGKKSTMIDMRGKELKDYFHYLNKVMHIPFIHGLKQKRRVQTIAYFSGGLIGMAAPEEQPQETTELLERFASVFNLTYTRFNDLKIAEKQAKQAEQDLINLQKAKKRAEQALSELQSTQKQLIQSEKMASLGELTAGIAHEIQNPLNFVNNFSDVSKELLEEMLEELENGDLEEAKAIMDDVIQNLDKINHHGKRADGIVKGMLQHSRASGDKKEPTDLNKLADEYLRLAYHGLRAKDKSFNAELVTDFDKNLPLVSVIPQDIGRVVLNLVTNAFYACTERSRSAVQEKQKSSPDSYKPTVSITTNYSPLEGGQGGVLNEPQGTVQITVTDNGNGIPDHVRDKIFQPFFTTKPTGEGTGLGLSMSYDIITKGHGGKLEVETKKDIGTTFTISLSAKI